MLLGVMDEMLAACALAAEGYRMLPPPRAWRRDSWILCHGTPRYSESLTNDGACREYEARKGKGNGHIAKEQGWRIRVSFLN